MNRFGKKLTAAVSTAAMAACVLSSIHVCAEDVTAQVDELKIGLVNPLSGDNALYGQDQSNALAMAIAEINEAGGVHGAMITVDEYDDQSDPQNAAKGAQKFADDDDYIAIVGSSLSSTTLAMSPIIDDAGIVNMVVSSSSPSLTGSSEYFFRMAVQDAQVGPQMARVMLEDGYQNIVVLYPNNDFGINLSENLIAYAEENGGTILDSIEYNPSDQDFSAILTTVKGLNPDAVALCGTVTDGALQISQMKKLGIDCFMMGGTSLYNPKAKEIAGDALEGAGCVSVYIASNPDEQVQEFVKKYEELYNETPDAFAALAYDLTYVFADACARAMEANDGEIDRDLLKDALKDTNYDGVTGVVSFNEDNDWVRDYLALEVKDGEFVMAE